MAMKRLIPLGVVVLTLFASVAFTAGNTITSGMQPRVDVADGIIGSWVLNREKSDDPREVMQESQEEGAGGGMRSGGGGGGRQRGGAGGRTSGGRTGGRDDNVSMERRQGMQAFMRDAMRTAPRIQISRTDSTVTLETPPQGSRILFTDNREVTTPITADLEQKLKSKWDGDKLVIETETDAGVKAKFEYERDKERLKIKVRIQISRPRQVIRYELVYDPAD